MEKECCQELCIWRGNPKDRNPSNVFPHCQEVATGQPVSQGSVLLRRLYFVETIVVFCDF